MHKILAYFLLLVGLTIMSFAFTGMYQTFVNKKPVVQVVTLQPLLLNTQYGSVQVDSTLVGQVINIGLFALFMLFLSAFGAKIAAIGNTLLKTERVCQTLQMLRRQEALSHKQDIEKL